MISFSDFLLEQYYYHGTSVANSETIDKDGLNPGKSKYDGKVYMSRNYGEAYKYGKIANNGKAPIVYKIHKDNLKPEHIHSDHSGIIEYKGHVSKEHISRA
jgi:RNA:NAD 2'-phosphotransferase (TPT1/KptA family)